MQEQAPRAGHRRSGRRPPRAPLPSPRRNPTCRSRPPPAAPGTRPEPEEHRFPGTIVGPAHPSDPLELAAPPGRPNPRCPSARPGPPFPGHAPRPGPSRRAGPPSLRLPGGPRRRSPPRRRRRPEEPRRSAEGPGLAAAAAPPPPDRARPPPLDTYGLLRGCVRHRPGRWAGARGRQGGGTRVGSGERTECATRPGGAVEDGASALLARGGGDGGRRARSLLHTARSPAQRPRKAPTPRRARASLLLPRRAPRLSFYSLLPARRGARAPAPRHTAAGGVTIPLPPSPRPALAGRLRPCPAPRRHWPSPACPRPDRLRGGPGRERPRPLAPGWPMSRRLEPLWAGLRENLERDWGRDVSVRATEMGWGG